MTQIQALNWLGIRSLKSRNSELKSPLLAMIQPGFVIIGTCRLGSGSLCQLNVDLGSFNKILTLPSLNFEDNF